ncbi:LacI family DNA-binding transcriptional regulator [Bifidobacterium platyrrhinorum]|uniref:LacI family DNA-binding transcriptional regulator n=1 Tax=Bifidobacterium platyrrhinorum TaxID=2661628 RepID=UPI00298C3A8E|nr:LacI family DNA-binding transcriptional regulator [Bifidobacterium platyrrhinorum]
MTIKDVAREASVSFKTVSNVINGTGSMRPETRQRVEEAIERLGYSVNMSARMLKSGTTNLIGLAVCNFTQPFMSYLACLIIKAAKRRNYGVVINTYEFDGAGLEDIVTDCPRLGADGWIFYADRPLRDRAAVLDQQFPVVLAGDYSAYGRTDSVTMPNKQSLYDTVSRLLRQGYDRIGLIGVPDEADRDRIFSVHEGGRALRSQGYIEAFDDYGKTVDWNILRSGNRWDSGDGERAVVGLLAENECPQVIVCLNDSLAIGAMHELQRRGYHVPDDVQIIGFDNIAEGRFANPALTTIDPDVEDFAQKAVDMLIERLEGYDGPVRTYTTDYTLIERGSTRFGGGVAASGGR